MYMTYEAEIRLEYTIPNYLDYYKKKDNSSCPVCSNSEIFYFINPFLEADVPIHKIHDLILERFNLDINPSTLAKHNNHYTVRFNPDVTVVSAGTCPRI